MAKTKKLKRAAYDEALKPLQVELNRMLRWVQDRGHRVMVLFEGRDTAGKGGAISAIASCLNPRSVHVVALGKPTERERSQWYFQRYVPFLPAAGEITLLDRSWYNRAGVERVMGFCTEAEAKKFLKEAPVFEQLLVDDGILLFKYWLGCDQEKQEERFAERVDDPIKHWKISPIDLASREKYADYSKARDQMLKATHTEHAPWTLVDMNDQKRGRLSLIRDLLDRLPDVDVQPDPIELPALAGEPLKESYPSKIKRVADFDL